MENHPEQLCEASRANLSISMPVTVQIIIDECNLQKGVPSDDGTEVHHGDILQIVLGPDRELYDAPVIVMDDAPASESLAGRREEQGWRVKRIPGDWQGGLLKSRTDPFVNREIYRARRKGADVLVLVSGDGDFEPGLTEAREAGKRIEIVTWRGCLSCHLHSVADEITYLDAILPLLSPHVGPFGTVLEDAR